MAKFTGFPMKLKTWIQYGDEWRYYFDDVIGNQIAIYPYNSKYRIVCRSEQLEKIIEVVYPEYFLGVYLSFDLAFEQANLYIKLIDMRAFL